MNILVYIQSDNNTISRNSLEALVGAQNIVKKMNGCLKAVCFNANVTNELLKYNINEIICPSNNEELNNYNPLYHTSALEQIVHKEQNIDLIVFGHTYQARDWVPRLSARLDSPFVSDCVSFNYSSELEFVRQMYQGKVNTNISVKGFAIISFQSGAFRADAIDLGTSTIKNIEFDFSSVSKCIRPGDKFKESKGEVDLTRSEIIVSVGRGIGKEENMPVINDLNDSLGGEIGSSRPVVDYGWLSHERQVGSSGQVVTPKMYLAIGISGAIQHQVGMKGSDNIVAINKDPNAPIFEIADYGVVGDLFEILPKLTSLIKDIKS